MNDAVYRTHTCFTAPAANRGSTGLAACGPDELDRVALRRTHATTTFPVLAALAPVITSPDNELAYPGDPMCLYSALALTVSRSHSGPGPQPDWGPPPSKAYRLAAPDDGIRPLDGDVERNSDLNVFDPRVWTEETQQQFRATLRRRRPHVLLISSVSAAHRYGLHMAAIAKQELPQCVVILGGRHADETVRYAPMTGRVMYAYSSTVAAIIERRAEPAVDFVVSGDGAYTVDLLMRAICRAMDDGCTPSVAGTVAALHKAGVAGERPAGSAVIVALERGRVNAFPITGPPYDLADLPAPYDAFTIRSRFPIFGGVDGRARRTAHLMTAVSCPYRCSFCSESARVTGSLRRLGGADVVPSVARVCRYIHYGAEAIFVDDPVFWAGNFAAMTDFSQLLSTGRRSCGADLPPQCRAWLRDPDDIDRLRGLSWGMQLTVDLLTTVHRGSTIERMLVAAKDAGCSYVYLGLESMSATVMSGIHKNLHQQHGPPWGDKVRAALATVKAAGIRTGTSVLFGLDGETRHTIEETVENVGRLLDDGLLDLASANILTYHPATEITARHGMQDSIDYHSIDRSNRAPYVFFEEAYPDVVSRLLDEDDVWHIHRLTRSRWGGGRHGGTDNRGGYSEATDREPSPASATPVQGGPSQTLGGERSAHGDLQRCPTSLAGSIAHALEAVQ
ncbi:B12-binding domain-containing radical SAM protein [Dactylosporangium sp. CA-092794]|uniref:B12-binding domain-containing radical SAM protein n=1 Tax=Dactylosporangium sp. CA-092794 TaxID=3239929 RepID=UPI003D8A7952